jgi:type IX secretion system PorP/SprF family membrane protein
MILFLNKSMKFILFTISLLPFLGLSQQTLTSDINSNQVYHNPAFTGSTTGTRAWTSTRQQWLNPDYNFALIGSYSIGIDSYIDKFGMGIGAYFDTENYNGALSKTEFGIDYSYVIPIGSNIHATGGINASYNFLSRTGNQLTFIDQYNSNGSISATSIDILAETNSFQRRQMGFGAGGLIEYNQSSSGTSFNQFGFLISLAVKSVPFNYTSEKIPPSLPSYFNLRSSVRKGFQNNEDDLIGGSIFWQKYGDINQLTSSVSLYHKKSSFSLKYRGTIFSKKGFNDRGESAIVAFNQIISKDLRIGIAIDKPLKVSRLSGQNGSFEFTGWYIIKNKKVRESGNEIDLSKTSSNKFQTDCDRFRNSRKYYRLWPD